MNAIVNTTTTTVPTGTFPCQFGNRQDTSGYRQTEVHVLQVRDEGLTTYLVEEVDDTGTPTGTLGLATARREEDGFIISFYCANARTVGSSWGGVQWTRESAIQSLGFKPE